MTTALQRIYRLFRLAAGRPVTSFERAKTNGMAVGRNVWVDTSAIFDESCAWLIEIGDEVVVAPHAFFVAHDASTKKTLDYTRIGRTRVGRGVFIGARALILPGITIGERAIVAAGSVVTRDVPPGAIVAGNPARKVGLTEEYLLRQADALEHLPRFPAAGYTQHGGITEANKREMIEALSDRRGFVQ